MSLTDFGKESVESYCNSTSSSTKDGRVSGRVRIELTDEEMVDVEEIARARNQSYEDGRTADTNYTSDDGLELHETGLMAEKAMSLLYEEAEVDRSISATGDDGIDCLLEIDGETVTVDVKATTYQNGWLLLKQGYDHENADIFVSTYVDEEANSVELVGFETNEELVQDSMLEESPAPYMNHSNFTKKSNFKKMPEPNTERDWEQR
ncbi:MULTISPECIES: hypothetical protein [Haloarcula]|uniref:hypothetical protein n=1 Tax=Haloarcula TaxID=2237 RepID=UPI000F8D136D|nr:MULTISPECIES: hypothetical protein [Haloarcula]NHX41414.1 hypothetical protein [Haloarcula sp. R1-2]